MLVTLVAAASLIAGGGAQPMGVWTTAKGEAQVRLAACGPSVCGYPLSSTPDKLDDHNADPTLRSRPMKLVQILRLDLAPDGAWRGWIYSPRNGKTYRATLQMQGSKRLKLTGCLVGPLCQSQIWTRSGDPAAAAAS